MPFQTMPFMLRQLAITALLSLSATALPPNQAGVEINQLFGRAACASTQQACGFYSQLCCPMGGCYTDANAQAQCSTPAATAVATGANGYWTQVVSTITTTGALTLTTTYSTFVGSTATAVTPASTGCNYAMNETPCGSICCASNQYCYQPGSCAAAANGGSSAYFSSFYSTMYATTNSAGVPLRPTSSTLVIITANPSSTTASTTMTPGTTEPFQTPVATGANVTITSAPSNSSSGLSGGAIAGIVIGVLAALLILGCILFYCCLRGLIDGCLACFGLGGRRREKEVDIYERRTHHAGGGGGRTWYGAAKPARSDRPRRRGGEFWNGLGVLACLGGLWAILGLKRRGDNRRRREEEKSEYSYYSSDYYTSASSASSDDRRTRDDRYSRR